MAAIFVRSRYVIFLATTLILFALFFFRVDITSSIARSASKEPKPAPSPVHQDVSVEQDVSAEQDVSVEQEVTVHPPIHEPIGENFPLAANAKSRSDLPAVPTWNQPPQKHVPEKTPLFIGFTCNWPLLRQVVVGYITAGWPAEDIIVVENTGVMDANEKGKLTLQNPFFLDHHRLKNIFGVKVMVTPTLYTFAQLQSLYLYEAIQHHWPQYLWSHMDVMPQSREDRDPYRSLYQGVVDAIRETKQSAQAADAKGRGGRWALRFFAYDWLTMMNTDTMVELGGWDTMISYYTTDCDMYERMRMLGFSTDTVDVCNMWDMYESVPDLQVLYREGDTKNSSTWHGMQQMLKGMQDNKNDGSKHGRNDWQTTQTGGQEEPYYRDPDGFATALEITIKAGVAVYEKKWGKAPCRLRDAGLSIGDAWKVEPTASL